MLMIPNIMTPSQGHMVFELCDAEWRGLGIIGGSGGGRKDFAQAGGTKPQEFEKAFQELKNILSR